MKPVKTQQDEERRAEELALLLGGLIAILLTRRGRQSNNVVFENGGFLVEGKPIDPDLIRKELLRLELRTGAMADNYVRRFESGRWSYEQWQEQMISLVTALHIVAAALASGSIQVAIRLFDVRQRIQEQKHYFQGFAKDVNERSPDLFKNQSEEQKERSGLLSILLLGGMAAVGGAGTLIAQQTSNLGLKEISLSKARSRARSYARAIRITYSRIAHTVAEVSGKTECRNRLTPADHCSTSGEVIGCPELSRKGWMPLGDMVPIGSRRCKWGCKCWIEYR